MKKQAGKEPFEDRQGRNGASTAKGVKKLAPFATKESADSPGPRLIEQLTKKMKDKKSASMSFEISPAEREVFEELRGFWEGHVIPGMQVQEGGQLKTRFSANEIKLIPHQDVRFKTRLAITNWFITQQS